MELRREVERVQAAEQVQRGKWEAKKTEEIRKATIRGLEPEVNQLIVRHTAEVRRRDQEHQVCACVRAYVRGGVWLVQTAKTQKKNEKIESTRKNRLCVWLWRCVSAGRDSVVFPSPHPPLSVCCDADKNPTSSEKEEVLRLQRELQLANDAEVRGASSKVREELARVHADSTKKLLDQAGWLVDRLLGCHAVMLSCCLVGWALKLRHSARFTLLLPLVAVVCVAALIVILRFRRCLFQPCARYAFRVRAERALRAPAGRRRRLASHKQAAG